MKNIACMAWLAGALLLGVSGCGFDPGDSSTSNSGGSSGSSGTAGSAGTASAVPGCYDDPAQGPLLDSCGVWVSNSLGDDANVGTQSQPVASLARAIELAKGGKGKVYACGETWTDPIIVPGDVSLHGGFDCKNGWAYVGRELSAEIVTGPGEIPLKMFDGADGVIWRLTDFRIIAGDAVEPSGSSIAVFIGVHIEPPAKTPEYDYSVEILRSEIFAGNAMDGLDGEPGDKDNPVALAGIAGNPGADACSGLITNGGEAPKLVCGPGDNDFSQGGAGGDGGPMTATDGDRGDMQALEKGGHGGFGQANGFISCSDAEYGNWGYNGFFGYGARYDSGRFLPEGGYRGGTGQDGEWGTIGRAGGGGGATAGSAAVCGGAANAGGAGGGSGGTGGCGGRGGKGGKPGGSSFALMTGSPVLAGDSRFVTGRGGKGGNGGRPQEGGPGGAAGKGGAGFGTVSPGCDGGDGGPGGPGGWGGGGLGGSVTPVVRLKLASSVYGDYRESSECTFEFGIAGDGGSGDDGMFGTNGLGANGYDEITTSLWAEGD